MRALLFIPLAVVLVCGCGYALCAALGWAVYPREMLIAASTCIVAGVLAVVPLGIIRYSGAATPANVAQASLVGTMIHLFVCIGVAAVVLMMKVRLAGAFTYWLMPFYWLTLMARWRPGWFRKCAASRRVRPARRIVNGITVTDHDSSPSRRRSDLARSAALHF